MKAAGRREGEHMTKEQRTELIRELVGHKHSGFTAGDEPILEAASDDRLESFRVAAQARQTNDEKMRTLEQPRTLTEEEFMKVAPAEIKTLVERTRNQDTARKAELVVALKTAQSSYSETELSGMQLPELEKLAAAMKIEEDAPLQSYIGRPIPRAAAGGKEDVFTNPPDPYKDGVRAMRAQYGLPNN
jgi:hypothetical protein